MSETEELAKLRDRVTRMEATWAERATTAAEFRRTLLLDQQEAKAARKELYQLVADLKTGQAVLQAKAAGAATLIALIVGALFRWLGAFGS